MFIVYKITNIINSKIYIGVHKTVNVDDGYMGSGTAIKNAIKKHGLENFKKEVLATFESKEDAYELEYSLTEDFSSSMMYNMKRGGVGGWSESARQSAKRNIRLEACSQGGKKALELKLGIFSPENEEKRLTNSSLGGKNNLGKTKSEEHRLKLSESLKGKSKTYPKNRKSRVLSEETKEKLRQKALERKMFVSPNGEGLS